MHHNRRDRRDGSVGALLHMVASKLVLTLLVAVSLAVCGSAGSSNAAHVDESGSGAFPSPTTCGGAGDCNASTACLQQLIDEVGNPADLKRQLTALEDRHVDALEMMGETSEENEELKDRVQGLRTEVDRLTEQLAAAMA